MSLHHGNLIMGGVLCRCMQAEVWRACACSGNQGGSYISILSLGGLEFGILNIISSYGNMW